MSDTPDTGTESTESAPADTTAPAAPDTPPAPPTPPADTTTGDGDSDDGEGSAFDADSPDVRKMRRENKSLRDRFKAEQEARETLAAQVEALTGKASEVDGLRDTLAKLAAVFNPQAEPAEEVDPAKLAEQAIAEKTAAEERYAALLAEKDAEMNTLRVQAALPSAFAKAQADPDLTAAVLTASGALSKLDPSADTFAADLESAVLAAVEANPKLKVAQVAPRSGSEITGRSGGSDQVTEEQLSRMSSEEITKALSEGRLKNVLAGRGR